MNSRWRRKLLLACGIAGLAAAIPATGHAATVTIAVDGQRQRASQLCWAATSAMAVDAFGVPRVTQAQLAAYHSRGIESRAEFLELKGKALTAVKNRVIECDADISECDDRNRSLLYGLTSVTGGRRRALRWEDLRQQIDQKRPVLFTWVYLKNRRRPESEHQLIILGYRESDATKDLLVWDPLPVAEPLQSVSHATLKNDTRRWISYEKYRNPQVHAGRSVEHGYTTYNLAVESDPVSLPVRDLLRSPNARPLSNAQHFSDALRDADGELRRIEAEMNAQRGETRRIGLPMPMISVEDGDLLAVSDPAALLIGTTSVLLVPVEAREALVDSFLLVRLDDKWQQAGVIDHALAQQLLEQRQRAAQDSGIPLTEFYAVGLPQRGTFFAGQGYREAAQLYALRTDPAIQAYAGRPRAVREQFDDLMRRVLRLDRASDQQP